MLTPRDGAKVKPMNKITYAELMDLYEKDDLVRAIIEDRQQAVSKLPTQASPKQARRVPYACEAEDTHRARSFKSGPEASKPRWDKYNVLSLNLGEFLYVDWDLYKKSWYAKYCGPGFRSTIICINFGSMEEVQQAAEQWAIKKGLL